ncbi:bifunctional ADP-dependent NAD(P)H-hydrate dehydratase/NAD(P)H-hydrate epimerase [Paludibacter sp.]
MKIFTTEQIRELDQYTIANEPIKSIDLMERAAIALSSALMTKFPEDSTSYYIFAGPGNNGGDALALARILKGNGYEVQVSLVSVGNLSADCTVNKDRLKEMFPNILHEHVNQFDRPEISSNSIIIDGLFGSGLSRPLTGVFAEVVDFINSLKNKVIAIDVPSGLNADTCCSIFETKIKANCTLSLQFPKIDFFYYENDKYIGKWSVLDIGLHPEGIKQKASSYFYLDKEEVAHLLKKRNKFSHKGSFGHMVLLAGSKGMAGASILAAKAALRTGVGLLSVHGPEGNRCILQTVVPEVIYDTDADQDCISRFYHVDKYDSIAIGPGIGMQSLTFQMLQNLLPLIRIPAVFDADAINIISAQKTMMRQIPEGSIFTPHPKEFERFAGVNGICSQDLLHKALEIAEEYQIYIVLKGAHTRIVTPEGNVYFNSTGNPGMATAGSGDVLTGIIGALLAQGYSSEDAAKLGVYIHGLAADLALENQSEESLMAGDIVEYIGRAFKEIS